VVVPNGGSATCTITNNDVASPALSLTKSANPTVYRAVGQVIVYTYTVKNTGNVTLSGPFNITDDKLGTFQCGTAMSLAPGASITCTKSYIIQASDVTANVETLPTGLSAKGAYGTWLQGSKSTMNITLSGLSPTSGIPNGIYAGWCIQDHIFGNLIQVAQVATLYSSIGSGLPADVRSLPWNKINYVLNHKIRGAGKTDLQFFQDVQTAIWRLLGEPNPDFGVSPQAQQMVNAANANPTYVPGNGDIVAVIVYSDGMGTANPNSVQESIIEVTVRWITNKATATAKLGANTVTSNQAQATIKQVIQVIPTAKIAPTATTCQQFASGQAGDLTDLFYNVKLNKIYSVAPGMSYYSKITAPASSFTIQVQQSNSLNWRPIGTSQISLWNASCVKTAVTGTYSNGTVTFNASGLTAGATYYISINYDPASLVGIAVQRPYPIDTYTYTTYINGAPIVPSSDSVKVKPK
jgi:hypothetical protein